MRTPQQFSLSLLSRTTNGWREWKSAQGQTLHQLVREGGSDEQQP